MKRFLPFIFILLLSCACNRDSYLGAFESNDAIRLEQKGKVICEYEPTTYQLSFNREKGEFRVHTDNMSDFFVAILDQVPTEQDQQVNGTLIWTTETDTYTKRDITLKAVKLEGDKIWLWLSQGQIGLVVKVLE